MKKIKLFWLLFIAITSLPLFSLLVSFYFASSELSSFQKEKTILHLETLTKLISKNLNIHYPDLEGKELKNYLLKISENTQNRITIIYPNGKVIADTQKDISTLDNHKDRPEIKKAIKGQVGISIRHSFSLGKDLIYFALPFKSSGKIIAVIRSSIPLQVSDKEKSKLLKKLSWGSLVILLASIGISFFLSFRFFRTIDELRLTASKIASGEIDSNFPSSNTFEISSITNSLKNISGQISKSTGKINRLQNEMNGILYHLREGIIAVDKNRNIITINKAAFSILSISEFTVHKDLKITQRIRNPEILKIIDETFNSKNVLDKEFTLFEQNKKNISCSSTIIPDDKDEVAAVIVIIRDNTNLKKMENIRKDFVANVSHELRTPITSIKGYAETLLDNNDIEADKQISFLKIIHKQAEKISAIIGDLLLLSKLDAKSENLLDQKIKVEFSLLLNEVIQDVKLKAEQKNITIISNCDSNIKLNCMESLMARMISNLIENAINYSPENSSITISCSSSKKSFIFYIEDEGIGIANSDLTRIFERFYRVDKSRSSKTGGTGLGLSLVKQIALLHGGEINVKSTLKEGSCFTIVLPI